MTITLGSTTLCAGDTRNSSGDPVGPQNLRLAETPGVAVREYVGADRVQPEHVRCDSGTLTFGVTRTFATAALALAYIRTKLISGQQTSEPSEGQLKFDDVNVFGPKSVVTQRVAALVGCTVAINYSITG
ncbi:MAG: hypothetical protein J5727_06795 [Kiritimatiellae bacterium]|nr:hypothetical protein [Kiritimatiellia bacterium]